MNWAAGHVGVIVTGQLGIGAWFQLKAVLKANLFNVNAFEENTMKLIFCFV